LVEDAPLDGLEAIAGVGKGALINDGVGVFEERIRHLVGEVDIDDASFPRTTGGGRRPR
jgi:hypothetical protein